MQLVGSRSFTKPDMTDGDIGPITIKNWNAVLELDSEGKQRLVEVTIRIFGEIHSNRTFELESTGKSFIFLGIPNGVRSKAKIFTLYAADSQVFKKIIDFLNHFRGNDLPGMPKPLKELEMRAADGRLMRHMTIQPMNPYHASSLPKTQHPKQVLSWMKQLVEGMIGIHAENYTLEEIPSDSVQISKENVKHPNRSKCAQFSHFQACRKWQENECRSIRHVTAQMEDFQRLVPVFSALSDTVSEEARVNFKKKLAPLLQKLNPDANQNLDSAVASIKKELAEIEHAIMSSSPLTGSMLLRSSGQTANSGRASPNLGMKRIASFGTIPEEKYPVSGKVRVPDEDGQLSEWNIQSESEDHIAVSQTVGIETPIPIEIPYAVTYHGREDGVEWFRIKQGEETVANPAKKLRIIDVKKMAAAEKSVLETLCKNEFCHLALNLPKCLCNLHTVDGEFQKQAQIFDICPSLENEIATLQPSVLIEGMYALAYALEMLHGKHIFLQNINCKTVVVKQRQLYFNVEVANYAADLHTIGNLDFEKIRESWLIDSQDLSQSKLARHDFEDFKGLQKASVADTAQAIDIFNLGKVFEAIATRLGKDYPYKEVLHALIAEMCQKDPQDRFNAALVFDYLVQNLPLSEPKAIKEHLEHAAAKAHIEPEEAGLLNIAAMSDAEFEQYLKSDLAVEFFS